MSQWLIGLFALLMATLLPSGPGLAGIDEAYRKPADRKSWGALLVDFVGSPGFGKSYALVVGISKFDDFSSLPTANDPLRMRDFLLNEAGFDYVHVLTDEKATKARIEELMVDVLPGMISKDDQFLFYWSGHGTQRPNDLGGEVGYLPLANSVNGKYATMISMGDIQRWDEVLRAKQALFLLDACFSGLAGVASMSDSRDLQIDQLNKPAHHLVSAGSAEEETIAGDRWGGSIFTDAVLRAVRGEADAKTTYPRDGVVSLSELIGYVKTRVGIEAPAAGWRKPITPQPYKLRPSPGEFFFLTNERKVEKFESGGARYEGRFEYGLPVMVMGDTPACDRDADQLFWEALKNETAPDYFEAYLKRVESGEFCGLFADIARLKLRDTVPAPQLPPAERPVTSSTPQEQPVLAEATPAGAEAALHLESQVRSPTPEAIEKMLNLSTSDWQQLQEALGFDPKGVDGRPGPNTRRVLASWQRNNGLSSSGYLTAKQRDMLFSEGASRAANLAADSRYCYADDDWSKSTVSTFQRVLTSLGYDTVEQDGVLDADTRRAIERYKTKHPSPFYVDFGSGYFGCLGPNILTDVLLEGRGRGIDKPVGYISPGNRGGMCKSGFIALSVQVYEAPTTRSTTIGAAAGVNDDLQPSRDGFCEYRGLNNVGYMLCAPC